MALESHPKWILLKIHLKQILFLVARKAWIPAISCRPQSRINTLIFTKARIYNQVGCAFGEFCAKPKEPNRVTEPLTILTWIPFRTVREIYMQTRGFSVYRIWHGLKYVMNLLPFRTSLLVLLATALGGIWTLEQPDGSLLKFHPTWREVLMNIFRCGGDFAVPYLAQTCTISRYKKKNNWDAVLNWLESRRPKR